LIDRLFAERPNSSENNVSAPFVIWRVFFFLRVQSMFPFSALNKTAPAPEVTQTSAKTSDVHPLDELTGGAFSAQTSSERTARIREWLATSPSAEQMQAVFKELSGKDKGASKLLREKLDEIKRSKTQESIAQEWADKANVLLGVAKLSTPFRTRLLSAASAPLLHQRAPVARMTSRPTASAATAISRALSAAAPRLAERRSSVRRMSTPAR